MDKWRWSHTKQQTSIEFLKELQRSEGKHDARVNETFRAIIDAIITLDKRLEDKCPK